MPPAAAAAVRRLSWPDEGRLPARISDFEGVLPWAPRRYWNERSFHRWSVPASCLFYCGVKDRVCETLCSPWKFPARPARAPPAAAGKRLHWYRIPVLRLKYFWLLHGSSPENHLYGFCHSAKRLSASDNRCFQSDFSHSGESPFPEPLLFAGKPAVHSGVSDILPARFSPVR